MSIKKTVAIAAAAGALTAVAMPAMAFENEFHGMYKLKYFLSNYENGGVGFLDPTGRTAPAAQSFAFDPATGGNIVTPAKLESFAAQKKNNNYFEQRARIQYTAKANDDLRLVTQFEIDSVFGDRAQALATRQNGGAMESDAVNLETKHVYLDFKIPSTPVRVTAGIQAYKDAIKGVLLDADLAGINTVTKVGPATLGLAYFRAYDQSYFSTRPTRGMDNLDILALNAAFDLSKDLQVGAAYYLYSDGRKDPGVAGDINIHTLGANFDAKLGALGLSGFAAMQQGTRRGAYDNTAGKGHQVYNGYAFNAAAKLAVGPGTLRTAALYTSGDDGRDNINTAWQSVSQTQGLTQAATSATNSYNESNMMLLNRATNMGGTTTDQSLVYTTNNKDQGVFLYTLGYDAKLGSKAYANANAGVAWASKSNANKPTDKKLNGVAGTNYMGTEINVEAGYKMYDNLTASLQAAYVILGGYYKDTTRDSGGVVTDPENPYTARVVLSYAF